MRRVLYITNIEVPYRNRFFNELAKSCDLTVLYERRVSKNRNLEWACSEKRKYKTVFLNGIRINKENTIDLSIFKYLFKGYDKIIIGCYNSPLQILLILIMKILKMNYCINVDGEPFIEENNIKTRIKKHILKGAELYFVAGEESARNIRKNLSTDNVVTYYFSSLSKQEILDNAKEYKNLNKNDYSIVIGQYFEYKGLDIALEIAEKFPKEKFKFIGMGYRYNQFKKLVISKELTNVEIIPFLSKEELALEYKKCKMLILPSRKECWGLVINEAASYGTPIISTYGSRSSC